MIVDSNSIAPSQDFLKEKTLGYIMSCIAEGSEDELPPTPIVRYDSEGKLVAIDGHNLIAVMAFLGRDIDVHIAKDRHDGIDSDSEASINRNKDLFDKFDACLMTRDDISKKGITSFKALIELYPVVFHD